MNKAIHISKERIRFNKENLRNDPFIKVIAANGRSAFGHEAFWNGRTRLKNFMNLPNGEQHIHIETDARVELHDTNFGTVEDFE